MEAKKVKVSIIILSWNTKQLLRDCLRSLKGMAVEIIVVDNSSIDGSTFMVAKEFPEVKLIKNQKNLGYGQANNQGMKVATGDYLLLLNSDTVVKNEAPLKMANFLSKNPKSAKIGYKETAP